MRALNLRIGRYAVDPPVVLAPMAGITNVAFRRLCREQGAGLYVCEMITSRALVERNPETMQMIAFDDDEHPRSLQLYGVAPATVGAAVRMVAEEDLADHVDLNFGCPVPKVTRRGGGAALPYKRALFSDIVAAAVRAADPAGIPVTVMADTAAGAAMAGGLVDAVLVGCDRVARNGDTANKIGTYTLAVLADANRIPFYVVGPLSSFDPEAADGAAIEIEQRPAAEVSTVGGARVAPDAAGVWNPAFDITPAALITAFITDAGVLRPPFPGSIAGALAGQR